MFSVSLLISSNVASGAVTFLNTWGSFGSGQGQFSNVRGLAVAPNGNVYAVDSANWRVQWFSSTGTYLGDCGTHGSGSGQFTDMFGIAINPNSGDFYAADFTLSRISQYTALGQPIRSWSASGGACNVSVHPTSGDVYVASFANDRVQIFTSAGSYVGQFPAAAGSIAVTADGTVYTGSNGTMSYYSSSGSLLGQWGSVGSGNGQFVNCGYQIATSAAGDIVYVADLGNNRIQRFSATGSYLGQWGTYGSGNGQFSGPWGIAVAPTGQVYVSEYNNNRISRFFDSDAWSSGTNYFTSGTTSVGVGPGQFLGAALTLNSVKGLYVGNTLTVVSAGTLDVSGGTLSTSALNIASSGVVTLSSGNVQITDATNNGSLSLNGYSCAVGSLAGSGAISLGGFLSVNSGTFAGVLSGSGGVTKLGVGLLVLTGSGTSTGVTTVSAGTLQIGNGGTTGSLVSDISNSGSVVFNRSNDIDYFGAIRGTGSLIKQGGGSLTLGGSASYSGATSASGGTLRMGAANSLPNGSAATVAAGSTIDLNGFAWTVPSVAGSGTVHLGNGGVLSINGGGSFTATVSGSGGLTKSGTGALVLTGSSGPSVTATVSGGTLQIGAGGSIGSFAGDVTNNAAIAFNRSDAFTFPCNISGTGILYKLGGNILTLSGTNSYTGDTNVNAGILRVGSSSALAAATNVSIQSGAQLHLYNVSCTINGLSGSGAIDLGGTLTVGGSGGGGTYSGAMSDFGALVKVGGGLQVLAGDNTYLGLTTVSAGSLQIGNGGASGSITGNVTNNAALIVNRSGAWSYAGNIDGSGSLAKQGAGVLALSGSNAYSGTTAIHAGTLRLASSTALPAGNPITLASGGTLDLNNYSFATQGITGSGDVALGAGTLSITAASQVDAQISGAGGLRIATSSGEVALQRALTYTGPTVIENGELCFHTSAALSSLTDMTIGASGVLDLLDAPCTVNSLNGSGRVWAEGNAITVGGNNGSGTFSGVISMSGSLNKIGGGLLLLTGANTYDGRTTISGGTLQIGNGGSNGSITGNVTNNAALIVNRSGTWSYAGNIDGAGNLTKLGTGVLQLSGSNVYSGTTAINAGTLRMASSAALPAGNPIALPSGGTLDLNNYSFATQGIAGPGDVTLGTGTLSITAPSTLEAQVSGAGGLRVAVSGGEVALQRALTYTGPTNIESGELCIDTPAAALPITTDVTLGSSGTLHVYARSSTINGLGGSGVVWMDLPLTVGSCHGGGSYSGAISSSFGGATPAALTKRGSGTQYLTGNNNYSGGTTIAGGVLSVIADANLGSGSIGLAGGTLRISGGSPFGSSKTIDLTANGTLDVNSSAGATWYGQINGSYALTKAGSGTLTLGNWNYYSGGTIIAGGLLRMASLSALGNNPSASLSVTGGTLDLNGFTQYVGPLSGNGVVDNLNSSSNGNLNVGTGNASSSFSGTIRNTGQKLDLAKMGSGTVTLTGGNTYSGLTAIYGGTLQVGNGGSGASIGNTSGVSVAFNSTLAFNHADSVYFTPGISGAGNLLKSGGGTLTLAGSISYTGSTQVNGGLLLFLADNASSSFTAGNGGTLRFQNASVVLGTRSARALSGGTIAYQNTAVTGGYLRGPGSHVLLAASNNSFESTTINNGAIVQQNGTATLTNVNNRGRIIGNGSLDWVGGENDSSGALLVNSACNVSEWLNNGVVEISSGGRLNNSVSNLVSGGGSQITVASGGTLDADSQGEGVTLDLRGSLLVNNGTVTGTTNVHYGATVSGSGSFGAIINLLQGGKLSVAPAASPAGESFFASGGSVAGSGNLALPGSIHAVALVAPNPADVLVLSGDLSGDGSVTKLGAGMAVLSGNNSYLGGTHVAEGALIVAGPNALADGSDLTVGEGTLFAAPIVPDPDAVGSGLNDATAVPEPGALALVAVGLWSAAIYRRLRRR